MFVILQRHRFLQLPSQHRPFEVLQQPQNFRGNFRGEEGQRDAQIGIRLRFRGGKSVFFRIISTLPRPAFSIRPRKEKTCAVSGLRSTDNWPRPKVSAVTPGGRRPEFQISIRRGNTCIARPPEAPE